jgi:hypothetical protein
MSIANHLKWCPVCNAATVHDEQGVCKLPHPNKEESLKEYYSELL